MLKQKVSKWTFPNVYYVELPLKRINVSFPPRVQWTEICELVLVKGILGSILSTNAQATCPAPTLCSGFSLPVPLRRKRRETLGTNSVSAPAASSSTSICALKCLWNELFYPVRKSFQNEDWRLFYCDSTLGGRVIQGLSKSDDLWRHEVNPKKLNPSRFFFCVGRKHCTIVTLKIPWYVHCDISMGLQWALGLSIQDGKQEVSSFKECCLLALLVWGTDLKKKKTGSSFYCLESEGKEVNGSHLVGTTLRPCRTC